MTATRTPPPQAPELGRMRRWLGSFHVTGVFWFRIHRWGVTMLPEWGVAFSIALFTTFFFVVLRRIRKAIASNLEVVLGPCGWWTRQVRIYRTLWNFAWCLSERYERLSMDCEVGVDMVDDHHWTAALAKTEGLILVTAHIGHWEVGSMLVPERHVHVVREEEMDPRAQEFIQGLFDRQVFNRQVFNRQSGGTGFTMHFAHGDPTLGPRLLTALRRGEYVAVQGDRPRSSGRSFQAELFGQPLDLPAGPAVLARAAGVDLLPVFIFRSGRQRSRVVFRPPIRVRTGERDRDLAEIVRQIAAQVEWAIRRNPYQWFCFRELWPSRPARERVRAGLETDCRPRHNKLSDRKGPKRL